MDQAHPPEEERGLGPEGMEEPAAAPAGPPAAPPNAAAAAEATEDPEQTVSSTPAGDNSLARQALPPEERGVDCSGPPAAAPEYPLEAAKPLHALPARLVVWQPDGAVEIAIDPLRVEACAGRCLA